MKLGGLGRQVVAVVSSRWRGRSVREPSRPRRSGMKRMRQGTEKARQDFDRILHKEPFDPNDVYMLDLMREG